MSEIPEDMHLIVSIMGQMTSDAHASWSQLVDGLTVSGRRDQARVALIRDGINELLSGAYMPMPGALTDALYPSNAAVDAWLVRHYGKDWRAPETQFQRCWNCPECVF